MKSKAPIKSKYGTFQPVLVALEIADIEYLPLMKIYRLPFEVIALLHFILSKHLTPCHFSADIHVYFAFKTFPGSFISANNDFF